MSVPPEHDHAAAILAAAAFGIAPEAELRLVKERENQIFRVVGDGFDRSLRMHRVGYRTDDELRAETAMIEAFGQAGVPVPAPVRSSRGEVLAVVTDPAGIRRQATMQKWIDGGTDFGDSAAVFTGEARPADAALEQLGRLIGQMHAVAESGAPDASARAAWDEDGLVGPAALWGAPGRLRTFDDSARAVLGAAERRIGQVLRAVPKDPSRYGLIHADFTFENVLVTTDGLVLLDFDDAGAGWYAFDLATPLFWCSRHPDALGMAGALVRGYEQVRNLPADGDAWQALLLARGLTYLGWAADRPGSEASDFHEEVLGPWILAAAERFVATGDTGWSLTDALTDAEARR